MLKLSLCNYSDWYILVKEAITIRGVGAGKGVIFKNCPLTA